MELEKCIQLTPKFTDIYALSHIETLFQILMGIQMPPINEAAPIIPYNEEQTPGTPSFIIDTR